MDYDKVFAFLRNLRNFVDFIPNRTVRLSALKTVKYIEDELNKARKNEGNL